MAFPSPFENLRHRLGQAWQRGLHIKAMSFALVGLANAIVDFSIFALAYYVFGLPIVAANICSWFVAVTGSYVMNSLITFAAESNRQLRVRDYLKFSLTQTGGLIANTVAVYALHYFVPVLAAKVLAIGASFLVNFSLSHFIVFRQRDPIH
jgi:putative flippase GtrA